MRKGLTLIELMITVVMIAILMAVTIYIFRAILLSWSGAETRAGIDIGLDRGIEEMARDLREATRIYSSNDEIRFIRQGESTYYIYYFYNSGDTYQLRKAVLTVSDGDIGNGTFTSDSGNIIISDVLPPPTSDLSEDPGNTNVYIIDLSVKRKDETIRSKTQVRPRNLCGSDLVVTHLAGGGFNPSGVAYPAGVAPVDKTVTYGTFLSTLGGTGAKCWITQNLGASNQASSATDGVSDATDTHDVAGWYWQFKRKQGYQYTATRTPATWDSSYDATAGDWTAADDPCRLLLGEGWRLPTSIEWTNADGAPENWTNYNHTYASVLKLHAAGLILGYSGGLAARGTSGFYCSSTEYNLPADFELQISSTYSFTNLIAKSYGLSVRCLKD